MHQESSFLHLLQQSLVCKPLVTVKIFFWPFWLFKLHAISAVSLNFPKISYCSDRNKHNYELFVSINLEWWGRGFHDIS